MWAETRMMVTDEDLGAECLAEGTGSQGGNVPSKFRNS